LSYGDEISFRHKNLQFRVPLGAFLSVYKLFHPPVYTLIESLCFRERHANPIRKD
jgi:hypothetical protein